MKIATHSLEKCFFFIVIDDKVKMLNMWPTETSLMQAQKDIITQKSRVSDCLANMDQSLTTVLSSFEIPTIPARCRGILQRCLRALTSRFPRDPD